MQPTTKIYGQSEDLAPGSTLSGVYTGAAGYSPTTPIVAQTAASPTAPTSFSLNIPNAIPSSSLGSNSTLPGVYQKRNAYQSQLDDIQKQLAASQAASDAYQQQVLSLGGMSEQEQALQNQITGLNQSRRSEFAQLDKDGNLTLDQNAIQQQTRNKDYNLSILAKSENLANLTGVRQSKLDSIKTALGFEDKRYERLLGLEDKFRTLDKEEKTQARQDINDILTFAEGKSYEELDPESQLRIQQAVALTPFTLGQIEEAMKRSKVAYDEERAKAAREVQSDQLDMDYKRAQIGATNRSNLGVGGGMGVGGGGAYGNDLDALIGTVLSTIPSKFGQETFQAQMGRARNDADKINLIAAQVLKNQPAELKTDFANQAVGISQIDKAINLIDSGVETGVLQNAAQYTFNLFGKDFDPKLAQISSYITGAIQPYRNSVTGAAWGDQEDAEYSALFGTTKFSYRAATAPCYR